MGKEEGREGEDSTPMLQKKSLEKVNRAQN